MESHNFWSWSRVSPSRFRGDRFLVNFGTCEYLLVEFMGGNFIISAEDSSEYEEGLFEGCSEDEEGLGAVMADIIFQGSQCF